MKILALLCLGMIGFAFGAEMDGLDMIKSFSVAGAVIGLGIAALGGAIGMGHAAAATISGTARNPGISGKLLGIMFITLALIEAQVIYTLVLALIAFYANPFIS